MPSPERGFAHLMLIVALFGLIFILALFFLQVRSPGYQITNPLPSVRPANASDKQTEKTYSNNQLGLTFSYSAQNYEVKEDTEDTYFQRANGNARKNFNYYVGYPPAEFVGAVDLVSVADGSFDNAPFVVWVFNNPDNLDAAGWFKKYWYYPFNWGQFEGSEKQKLAPINSATVGGENGLYGQVSYQSGNPKYYYVSKNGKMYLTRVLGNDKTLNSLKFL